jgi:hypothetical protein
VTKAVSAAGIAARGTTTSGYVSNQ